MTQYTKQQRTPESFKSFSAELTLCCVLCGVHKRQRGQRPAPAPTLLPRTTTGIETNVTSESLYERWNINPSTPNAEITERRNTLTLRPIWSASFVVSADRREVMSPVFVRSKKPTS